MAIDFEKLKDNVSDLAQTGVAKAKELADVAVSKGKELSELGKLKVNNATERETIKKAYLELGKLYFAERGSAPEAPYADLCQKIQTAMDNIEYNNQRIADIKSAGNAEDDHLDDIDELDDEEAAGIEIVVTIEKDAAKGEDPAPAAEDTCDGCDVTAGEDESDKPAE